MAFEPPGPGMWNLDRSHYPGGTTAISQWLMEGCPTGMRPAFEELGMPAQTLDVRFVDGFMYSRLRPLIAPDRAATKQPPAAILRLVTRLHPGFRKRSTTAAKALVERPWRKVVADWESTTRPGLERQNDEFAAVDERSLGDAALADHIGRLMAYIRKNFELHFYLHAFDLGPIGLLLADCDRWGLDAHEVIPALAGASPSTSRPAEIMKELRRVVAGAGAKPRTLDEVRAVLPEASKLLDEYLARRGRMMVTRYDLDGRTLEEQPDVVVGAILEGSHEMADEVRAQELAAALREKVPAAERPRFDERLAEARATMDLRDDNGPNTVELPVGLLRHALLEAGRRLVERGRIATPHDLFELEPSEVVPMVRDGRGPSSQELLARAARRSELAALTPPAVLGPTEVQPPLDVLSPAHQVLVGAVQAVLVHMGMAAEGAPVKTPLQGVGIGAKPYQGTARVAMSPEEALDSMEPGDVLVVRFTTPAFNTVLSIAGAIITTEGALLSHAAVMARELGIPAIIGAAGALTEIPDGAQVEVDPAAGQVRVLAPH